ncbi:MAG: hypothetical protein LUD72_07565, partial [Bacteroidales bacterium]|nr:hypothetical protein [Bacteroidales bacterium]
KPFEPCVTDMQNYSNFLNKITQKFAGSKNMTTFAVSQSALPPWLWQSLKRTRVTHICESKKVPYQLSRGICTIKG